MPICKNCGNQFKTRITIDGKLYFLHKRKYCLECNPLGERRFSSGSKNQKQVKEKKICKTCNKLFIQKSRNNECSTCRAKDRRKEQKEKVIEYLGGKCKICGYNRCRQALDVHHLDEKKKKFSISTKLYNSFEFLKEELDKCMLLCCRCHAEVHAGITDLQAVVPELVAGE